jgi:protein-S-isoprenylcysteine O-methyltransferase Ste14
MNRIRVFFGYVAGILFAVFAHVSSWERLAVGLVISFLGLLLRGWAAGYLEKGKRLAQDGPYAVWRHPLYSGSFFMALGFCVAGTGSLRSFHSLLIWAVFVILFLGLYPPHIRQEEAALEKTFGDAWRDYFQKTLRFWPRFPPLRRPDPDRFLWSRFRKNQEYNALLGWLAGAGLLWAKAILRA